MPCVRTGASLVWIAVSSPGEARSRLARRAVTLTESRWAVGIVFVVALCIWWLEAIVIPLGPGRDLGTYLGGYVQLFQSHPIDLGYVLGRTPIAMLVVGGLLDFAGGALAELVVSLLYAGSVVAWFVAARMFGASAALLTVVVLLLYPGYGILFHELSSDAVVRRGVRGLVAAAHPRVASAQPAWLCVRRCRRGDPHARPPRQPDAARPRAAAIGARVRRGAPDLPGAPPLSFPLSC